MQKKLFMYIRIESSIVRHNTKKQEGTFLLDCRILRPVKEIFYENDCIRVTDRLTDFDLSVVCLNIR